MTCLNRLCGQKRLTQNVRCLYRHTQGGTINNWPYLSFETPLTPCGSVELFAFGLLPSSTITMHGHNNNIMETPWDDDVNLALIPAMFTCLCSLEVFCFDRCAHSSTNRVSSSVCRDQGHWDLIDSWTETLAHVQTSHIFHTPEGGGHKQAKGNEEGGRVKLLPQQSLLSVPGLLATLFLCLPTIHFLLMLEWHTSHSL